MAIKRLSTFVFLAMALSACSVHQSIPAGSTQAMQRTPRITGEFSWRDALARTRLPSAGCFTTSYPSAVWVPTACSAVTEILPPDRKRFEAHQVGGPGGQIEAYVNPTSVIEEAIGSFPYVKGIRWEHSIPSGGGPSFGPNSFSLQMNSEFFSTAACGANRYCAGWEQFVFGNHAPGGSIPSHIFIQDWLLAGHHSALACPAGGWTQFKNSCVYNGRGVNVPYVLAKNLASVSMWGRAESSGDSVFIAIGKRGYAVRNAQDDSVVDLASHWGAAQFNVIGDGGGSEAVFNTGSTAMIQLQIETTGAAAQPLCVLTGSTTAESNTLNYSSIPAIPQLAQFPSIVFAESNARNPGNARCDALPASVQ